MPRWHRRDRAACARPASSLANAALHDTVAGDDHPRPRRPSCSSRDGPLATTKEILAGYYLLDCADLDEAISWARQLPIADYGSIELRPVFAPEDLPPGDRVERRSASTTARCSPR